MYHLINTTWCHSYLVFAHSHTHKHKPLVLHLTSVLTVHIVPIISDNTLQESETTDGLNSKDENSDDDTDLQGSFKYIVDHSLVMYSIY